QTKQQLSPISTQRLFPSVSPPNPRFPELSRHLLAGGGNKMESNSGLRERDHFGRARPPLHITININSIEFRELNSKLDDVIRLLRGSNEISGETRDQLIAEIKAGRALLQAPKSDPKL